MLPLFLTILLASLAGSLHCAGMCGAFVAFAIGTGDPSVKTPRILLQTFYHAGRLLTYTLLGILAGTLGATLDLGGSLIGFQRTAAVAAGAMMVGFGALTLFRLMGVQIRRLPTPTLLTNLATAGHSRTARLAPPLRALATGLLTTLLPCGWLYAFVITAAGTASPLLGAWAMLAFWLGTLPVLATLGFSMQGLSRLLGAKLPAITASAILLVGVYTIYSRTLRAQDIAQRSHAHSHASSTQPSLEQIRLLPTETPSCCKVPTTTPSSTQEATK